MAGAEVHLDYTALGTILRGAEASAITAAAAEAVASELRARGVKKVWVSSYVTDRAAAAVTVPNHEISREIRDGLITNAATAIGLEVTRSAS